MVSIHGVISASVVTHHDADVDTIARATPDDPEAFLADLLNSPDVEEAFLLCTCNRVECYVVTETPTEGRDRLATHFGGVPDRARTDLRHDAAIEHLCRVAAGLESQVLGEDEILGQVRSAYHRADDLGAIGPILEPAILKALHVGERARTETTVNEGVVSLASAATALAEERIHLPAATAVVVGAGDAGSRVARALADVGVERLVVANRSMDTAEGLVDEIGMAEIVELDAMSGALRRADLCVTATGSDTPVLGPDRVPRERSLLLIDLGQPPDVSPSVRERANVAYYDLDRLRVITERTHERRSEAAKEVERLIDREVEALRRQFKRDQAEEVIAAMRAGAEGIKRRELERARHRLQNGDAPTDAVVEDMADAIVNAIMAAPTEALRDAAEENDWATINAAIHIFDPSLDVTDLPAELAEPQEAIDD